MAKLIVVCGATGTVGGSVARGMLKEGWHVRALTRNVNGEAAKALASQGAELASADYDDEASLVNAFVGATAIFAITQFWEHIMSLGPEGAGKKDHQDRKLGTSIMHTLTSSERLGQPNYSCAHWDYKDRAAEEIKRSLPALAKKTTFMWLGWFTSNLFGLLKPIELPGTFGSHILIQPCRPDTIMWMTDIENNVPVFVKHTLAKPHLTLPAKVVSVHKDIRPYGDALKVWAEVSGKRAEWVQVSAEQYMKLYSEFSKELADQLRLNEVESDWAKGREEGEVLTWKELGIAEGELFDLKQSLVANKDKL